MLQYQFQQAQQSTSNFCYICEQKVAPSLAHQICCGKTICDHCLKQRQLKIVCPKCNAQHDPQRLISLCNMMREGQNSFFNKEYINTQTPASRIMNQKEIELKVVQGQMMNQNQGNNQMADFNPINNSAQGIMRPQFNKRQEGGLNEIEANNRVQNKPRKMQMRQSQSQTAVKKSSKYINDLFSSPLPSELTQHYNPMQTAQNQQFTEQKQLNQPSNGFFSQELHQPIQSNLQNGIRNNNNNNNNSNNFNQNQFNNNNNNNNQAHNNNQFPQNNNFFNNNGINQNQFSQNNVINNQQQYQQTFEEQQQASFQAYNNTFQNPMSQPHYNHGPPPPPVYNNVQFQQSQNFFSQTLDENSQRQFITNTPLRNRDNRNNQIFFSVRQNHQKEDDNFFINNNPLQSQTLVSRRHEPNPLTSFSQPQPVDGGLTHFSQPFTQQTFYAPHEYQPPNVSYPYYAQDPYYFNAPLSTLPPQPAVCLPQAPIFIPPQAPVYQQPIVYVVAENQPVLVQQEQLYQEPPPPQFGVNQTNQMSNNLQQSQDNNYFNNQNITSSQNNMYQSQQPIYLNFNENSKDATPRKTFYDLYHDSISSNHLSNQDSQMDLSSQNSTALSSKLSQYPKLNLEQNIHFSQISDWHSSNIRRIEDSISSESLKDSSIQSKKEEDLQNTTNGRENINFQSICQQQDQIFQSIRNNMYSMKQQPQLKQETQPITTHQQQNQQQNSNTNQDIIPPNDLSNNPNNPNILEQQQQQQIDDPSHNHDEDLEQQFQNIRI